MGNVIKKIFRKEDQNKINEELIFDPKILKFSEKVEKIIILRGR